jgi:hypothetical protein
MFKVGDKVKRTGPNLNKAEGSVVTGRVYTVDRVSTYGSYLSIAGHLDKGDAYPWAASHFELVEPAKQAAIEGGLQAHSVGGLYPVAIVGYSGKFGVTYFAENLQDSTVMHLMGHLVCGPSIADLLGVVEGKHQSGVTWLKGRPAFVHGKWVLTNPEQPVRVIRLHNMLRHAN